MDSEIDTAEMEVAEVDLVFRKPPEVTDFECVKTFWIDSKDELNSTTNPIKNDHKTENSDPEVKLLQPLALQSLVTAEDESGRSSSSNSEDVRLPDEVLDEPMDDDVFETEDVENVETDLLFRQPRNTEMELVYTISKGATINLDELEEEDNDVEVDLWFREPTDTRFELVYTIPLMEDVSVDSLGETLEDVPPAEELDNVVEEASIAEFTFNPVGNDEDTETETLTTEVVTVLEKAGEGSRDFIEKVKLTANDTFDNFDDEEEAFQNAFVKSVETPETPVPEENLDEIQDVSVSEVLKDAAEKLQIIQDSENTPPAQLEVAESNLKQSVSAPDFISEEDTVPEASLKFQTAQENPRFEISPVENMEPEAPHRIPILLSENQEVSDFAQLESISSPDEVPEVDRTLYSLRNEDVFPKEPTPLNVPKIEVTPEAEQPFLGLEDGGIEYVPVVSNLSNEEVKDAVEVPEVSVAEGNQSFIGLEDSGIMDSSDVVEVSNEESMNSEDVVDPLPVVGLENSGDVETPFANVVLSNTEVKDALNETDVVTADPITVTDTPESLETSESPDASFLGLEESGELEASKVPELDKAEVEEALNAEDVTGVDEASTATSGEPTAPIEEPSADETLLSALDQPVLGLEDSGNVDPAVVTGDLSNAEIKDALNEADVVIADSNIPESLETPETPAVPFLCLEEGGDLEASKVPELDKSEVEEALNSDDVIGAGVATSATNEEPTAQIEEPSADETLLNALDQPVLGLEDSGHTEPAVEAVQLSSSEIKDALNEVDVVTVDPIAVAVVPEILDTSETPDVPFLGLEEGGDLGASKIPELEKTEVEEALNGEDVSGVPTVPHQEPSEDNDESVSKEVVNSEEHEISVDEAVADGESQPVLGLEDGGDVETPVVATNVNNPEVENALNGEDIAAAESTAKDTEEKEFLGLEEGGDLEASKIPELAKAEVEEALNGEDVTGVAAIQEVLGTEGESLVETNADQNPEFRSEAEPNKDSQTLLVPEVSNEIQTPEIFNVNEDQNPSEDVPASATEKPFLGLEDAGDVPSVEASDLKLEEVAEALNSEDVVGVVAAPMVSTLDEQDSEVLETPNIVDSTREVVSNFDTENQESSEPFVKLEDGGVVETTNVVNVNTEVIEKALNSEDVTVENIENVEQNAEPLKVEEHPVEPAPNEDHKVYSEIPPEAEESVADSQSEEEVQENASEYKAEKETTPVPESEKTENQKPEKILEKLVSMVENVLPEKALIPSEDVLSEDHLGEANESPIADPEDHILASEESDPKDESIVQKLVSLVENALPEEAVLPSEDVLSEDHVGEETSAESPTTDPEEPTLVSENQETPSILDKLTSMVESVLPGREVASSEDLGKTSPTSEDVPTEVTHKTEEDSKDSEVLEETTLVSVQASENQETVESPSILDKLTSMVESVLPVDAVILSEYVNQKDKQPVHDQVSEKVSEDQKNEETEESNDTTASGVDESDSIQQENILEKLVSTVENLLPEEVVLPSEDVVFEEHIERTEDQEVPVVETEKADPSEELKQATEESDHKDDSIAQKLVSLVENSLPEEAVIPSEDVLSEDHRVEDSLEDVENSEKPTIMEKVVSMVESVLPGASSEDLNKTSPTSEDVLEADTENSQVPEEPTLVSKLVFMVEGVLPAGHSSEKQEDDILKTENENPATVETLIATSDIIPPIEGAGSLDPEVPATETEAIIETADIILPLEEQENVIETPFDAEGFVDQTAKVQSENPSEEEKVPEEKTSVVEELVAMAVDILPIDGAVSDKIEDTVDAVAESELSEEVKNVPEEKNTVVEELVAMAVDILPIDGAVSDEIEEKLDTVDQTVQSETPAEENNVPEETTTVVEELVAMAVDILPIDGAVSENLGEESEHPVVPGDENPQTSEEVTANVEETTEQEGEVVTEPESELFTRVKRADNLEAPEANEGPVPPTEPTSKIIKSLEHPEKSYLEEAALQVATVEVETEKELQQQVEDSLRKIEAEETHDSQEPSGPHKIADIHFEIPVQHEDYGNDYVPFGTEPSQKVAFNNPVEEEEEDFVAELNFHPVRQWKDEDVISLQSLKSLVAEVGCTTEVEQTPSQDSESTLKILKVVPSEPFLMELDISNDPSVIHVPIPLLEPSTKYLEEMVDWIIADAVKEVGEMEVVTESELSEMVPVPEPLTDLKLPFEDEEKTPEPEGPVEVQNIPQRPPRAPKSEVPKEQPKSKVRFGPLNIKLGRSYSEEQQKELVESLERPLTVITASEPEPSDKVEVDALSSLSPNTLDEYEHVPMMDMQSVPHSPQEKQEEIEEPMITKQEESQQESVPPEEKTKIFITETKILGPGKSMEYVDDEDGSECLDSIGDLSERTIQRFNTSIDDPSIRRNSFSSISSFGDRQKFRTAIENIRQDLLPFQSSVSQYLDQSITPTQQLLVTNLSMDSPSDLSPNAPPVGFENTAQYLEKLQQQQQQEDRPSAEGSIDSSGFEKVDHESLEDYGAPVHDPMQKSVFGSLTADGGDDMKAGSHDDGFVFIERNEAETKKMSSHHDDVIEKNYFGDDAATAKLLESPIAEEARKLVQDAVESASEYSKHAVDDGDEIGRELLDNVQHKIEQVKQPVEDALHKAYDGMGDFVHETVPQAVDDFVHEVEKKLPESPVPEKNETPEPLVDIHDTVDKVHDEIDNYLRREPTPPLVEADEDVPSDNKPHFGNQTPEEDETTFDRKGPLTIPEEVEKAAAVHKQLEDLDEFDPLVASNTGAAAASEALTEEEMFGHQKFETVPRPPTPPKDISDEDVKPSTVNLGPAHHHSHPSSPHHSILKHHGEAWIDFKTVPPCVLDVIYWRDAKKSAIVLSLALLALFILAKYPLLTVVTYSLILALGASVGFRVFKRIESQIKKTDTANPYSDILATDLSLPQEKVHAQADVFSEHATCAANKLKKLIFLESPLESVKFGLILWSLTYVASWFSGCTLAVLALLGVFSIPKVYESNQEAIDPHLATISGHLKNVQNLIDEKLPFLRSAPAAAEEKKDQ